MLALDEVLPRTRRACGQRMYGSPAGRGRPTTSSSSATGWRTTRAGDPAGPPPPLPPEVVTATRGQFVEAFERIRGVAAEAPETLVKFVGDLMLKRNPATRR